MDYQNLYTELRNGTLTEETLEEFQGLLELRLRQKYKNVALLASIFGMSPPDLIQELLIKALLAARTFDEEKTVFTTYLYRCIDNEIYSRHQSFRRNLNKGALVQREDEDVPITEQGFNEIDSKEELTFLLQNLPRLPEREEIILSLRLVGFTFEKIGKTFGISREAVHQRFHKSILPKLRGILNGRI